MDPHGADRRGNPLGGLVFSTAFGSSNGSQWTQATEWHNFMGADMFCLKACDPADSNDHHYCEHILDRIGCFYKSVFHFVKVEMMRLSPLMFVLLYIVQRTRRL